MSKDFVCKVYIKMFCLLTYFFPTWNTRGRWVVTNTMNWLFAPQLKSRMGVHKYMFRLLCL